MGASYVARSFSGDRDQLIPLIKGAIQHKGFALLDIISPCVTFNNHDTSTKSYDYIRNHNEAVGKTDFVPLGEEITTSYASGSSVEVNLHDGSKISLEKVNSKFDPTDQGKSLSYIREKSEEGKLLTEDGGSLMQEYEVETNDAQANNSLFTSDILAGGIVDFSEEDPWSEGNF